MQMDGRTQTYGKRETTLIGYPPAAPAQQAEAQSGVQNIAPPAAAPAAAVTAITAPYPAGAQMAPEAVAEPAANGAANLAANLARALAPEQETIVPAAAASVGPGTFLAPADVLGASRPIEPQVLEQLEPLARGERRNPRSRRLPINRGRHLSRTFFEEGDKQEEAGWENSPLAEEPFDASSTKLGFSSFDRVPRKRGPVIAAAAGVGMVAAILGAWALGGSSSKERAKPGTDVWSALRVPGAGWQPQAPTPVHVATTAPRPAAPTTTPQVVAPAAAVPATPAPARTAAAVPAVAAPVPAPVAVAKPVAAPKTQSPKAPAPVAFAPTRDVAKAAVAARPLAVRATTPANTGTRRHAVAARRVQARPVARTPVPARARVKSSPAPAVTAASDVEATEPPPSHDPSSLPAASAAPEPAVTHEAPAAEPESAPGDGP